MRIRNRCELEMDESGDDELMVTRVDRVVFVMYLHSAVEVLNSQVRICTVSLMDDASDVLLMLLCYWWIDAVMSLCTMHSCFVWLCLGMVCPLVVSLRRISLSKTFALRLEVRRHFLHGLISGFWSETLDLKILTSSTSSRAMRTRLTLTNSVRRLQVTLSS